MTNKSPRHNFTAAPGLALFFHNYDTVINFLLKFSSFSISISVYNHAV